MLRDSLTGTKTQTVGQPTSSDGYNSCMTVVVSLRGFVGEMEILSDETHSYINKLTGELITVTNDDITMTESEEREEAFEWQDEIIRATKKVLASDDYLEIPSKFDIDEYAIMERFCLSVGDEEISDALLGKIRDWGAFRRFKDAIYFYGIEKDWFKFRDQAYKEIAISWLEHNGFAYVDDLGTKL
jgi:uncharacterized protein UPF0158